MWCGVVWRGVVWCDVVWYGVVWFVVVCCVYGGWWVVRCGVVCCVAWGDREGEEKYPSRPQDSARTPASAGASPPIPPTHAHTHAHAHANTYTHAHTHIHPHPHSRPQDSTWTQDSGSHHRDHDSCVNQGSVNREQNERLARLDPILESELQLSQVGQPQSAKTIQTRAVNGSQRLRVVKAAPANHVVQ